MKRVVVLISVIAMILVGCSGPDGKAYQKYWWTGSLGYIFDTNPSTPATIYNDVYFATNPGSYYLEYQSWNGSQWYMYYKISVQSGGLFFSAGDDSWFEIGLYSTGPVLYRWSSASVEDGNGKLDSDTEPSPSTTRLDRKLSEGRRRSEVLGADEITTMFGSIQIEYGRILD